MNRYTKSPVGAHYGLTEWLLQRLTAVVMALYTIFFGGCWPEGGTAVVLSRALCRRPSHWP